MATTQSYTIPIIFEVQAGDLDKTLDSLVKSGRITEVTAASYGKLDKAISEVNKDNAAFAKTQAEVEKQLRSSGKSSKEASDGFTSLRTRLREAKEELQRVVQQFGEFSPQAVAARARAGELADELDDLNRQVNLLGDDNKLRAFSNLGQAIGSAFGVATGALQLFGAESEEAREIAQKFQGALNIVQGLGSITALKDSFKDLKVVLGITTGAQQALTAATTAGAAGQTALAGATTATGAASTGAATGVRALTAALAANPFGAIAVAVGALVGALILLNDTTDDSIEKSEGYKTALNDLSKAQNTAAIAELRLAQSRTNDLKEKEKIERQIQQLQNQDTINQLKEKEAKINEDIAKKSADLIKTDLLLAQGNIGAAAFQGIRNFFNGTKKEVKELQEVSKLVAEEIKVTNKALTDEETLRREEADKKIIQSKKTTTNKSVDITKAGIDAELQALLDGQAEIDRANSSAQGLQGQFEQEKNRQLAEINAQAALDKLAVEIQTLEQINAIRKKFAGDEGKIAQETARLQAGGQGTAIAIELKASDLRLAKLKEFGKEGTDEYQKELLERARLNAELTALDITEDAKRLASSKKTEAEITAERKERTELAVAAYQETQGIIEALQAASFQREADGLQEQRDKNIITEEQYQEKLKQLKAKQARADKEAAIFEATIAFSQALLNALTFKPANAVPIALKLATITAAANLAKIIATPLPKFKKGTLSVPGLDGGQDSIMAMLRPGEAVIPTETNRAYAPAIRAIYQRQIKPSEINAFVRSRINAGKAVSNSVTANVDAFALGKVLSKNRTVDVGNAQMIGSVIANELSKRTNIRQVI